MLGNWAHKGPWTPSGLEERKGLKEAQTHGPPTRCGPSMLSLDCGVVSASLEGSRRDRSTAPHISASLEGSEPTLERANHLCLARG